MRLIHGWIRHLLCAFTQGLVEPSVGVSYSASFCEFFQCQIERAHLCFTLTLNSSVSVGSCSIWCSRGSRDERVKWDVWWTRSICHHVRKFCSFSVAGSRSTWLSFRSSREFTRDSSRSSSSRWPTRRASPTAPKTCASSVAAASSMTTVCDHVDVRFYVRRPRSCEISGPQVASPPLVPWRRSAIT